MDFATIKSNFKKQSLPCSGKLNSEVASRVRKVGSVFVFSGTGMILCGHVNHSP